jgi:tRNA-uridine 2-sulfurtransferase
VRSFAEHLDAPSGKGALAGWPYTGAAGGAACGDLVRIAVRIEDETIVEAGFDAEGCGALTAAASATVELIQDRPFLNACRLSTEEVARSLGGLTPSKRHAAELVVDALHRALGQRRRAALPDWGGAPGAPSSP